MENFELNDKQMMVPVVMAVIFISKIDIACFYFTNVNFNYEKSDKIMKFTYSFCTLILCRRSGYADKWVSVAYA